ncbi:GlcD FAD FMN-containing dehydrogenase [Pyrenophora tritici-repentis]|uniref:FAD binding domain containing protein n=2 Tax=Pyrenophora tritici-repentis TaxID=45151 RepID=A0A2W1E2R5_9PLEO|nr:FAD binding domain containing protein [Pyrenophora tritici-repentis Pt-1C-BFP]KAA8626276.1 FAD binding domain-containing protein [Pyrenophora tritici-repentis]EDU41046.1 FAD binding domain containing protein [Pyrenophora tritici-repentis Pt-1C-BFP]KAF7454687.1 FAD binding domain containing protein [Pyrenophora tritici-repentis]KAF7577817.1 GlcD, FAD-FMN-containing dehydrogenase [Pyrenophora tritici-repentis]KAG9388443.1 FAD binding domain containing protein [Pyrenophora tritici-repentis]
MRVFMFSALVSFVTAQTFEDPDFNVTKALIAQGVNVSAVPELAGLVERSSNRACHIACSSLEFLYGKDRVDFQNEAAYAEFTSGFWSGISAEVRPHCIFKPSSPPAVSVMVLLSRLTQCPFAVKSGGHSAFAGAATIEGGITMSSENLKGIELSSDKKTVAVQPGNNWGSTLTALSNAGVTVVAGRIGDLGVGGLTLGGGISFITNEYGLACDNVASFDVVTAKGTILTASPTTHPDLFWALRGGGNNFGIVTSFNLTTKPLPNDQLWGGTRTYTEEAFPAVVKAWIDLTLNSAQDPKAGSWVVWINSGGAKIVSTELWYGAPDGNASAILAPFYNITAISDTTKTRGHASYVVDNEASNTYGLREIFYDITVKASYEIAQHSVDIFYDTIGALSEVKGAFPVLIWQHITDGSLKGSTRNGGNAMGFDANGSPIHIIQLACSWDEAADDDTVFQVMSNIMKAIKRDAMELGVQNDWVYMNYAAKFQDVIASYGPASKSKLKTVAEKYDPTEVFQTLQPGYFKLDRAAVPDTRYFSY